MKSPEVIKGSIRHSCAVLVLGQKTQRELRLTKNPTLNRAYVKALAMCRFIDEKVPGLIPQPWVTVMGHLLKRHDITRCNKGDISCSLRRRNYWPTSMQRSRPTHMKSESKP
jgi:hypothetical protein